MKTLKELSEIVLAHPKIVSGFLQETQSLEEHVVSKVPGGAGSTAKGQRYTTEYRCFLRTDGAHAERSSKLSPIEAITAVFEELKLKAPTL